MRILIVEDEEELLNSVLNYLQEAQFHCEFAVNIENARRKLFREKFDCCVIDIGLPDGSGLDLIREVKEQDPELCILIISARNSIEDKVQGLNIGADDYITKPFDLSELNARINSALRRYRQAEIKVLVFNEIRIHTDTFQVFINGNEVNLTKKEYELLVYFIANKDKVITKQAIVSHLWENYHDGQESFDLLYAHIKNLRKKITSAGCKDYIHNINRIGYRLRFP